MADIMTPQVAFRHHEFQPPQGTISFPETSLSQSPSRSQTPLVKEEPSTSDTTEDKKPAKKRKSWGQELPTPKTNLPPRKRAKTEDEKEQRRIERVLRNRAAAQSSRERKRQEVEKLEGEKSTIEQQNQWLKDRLMAVEHEKFLLGQKLRHVSSELASLKSGSSVSSGSPVSSPEPIYEESFDHIKIKQEIEEHTSFPSSTFSSQPTFSSSPSSMTYSPSVSPTQPSLTFDDDSSLAASPDLTQHPAAVLWFFDLQCQSAMEASAKTEPSRPQTQASVVCPSIPSSLATTTISTPSPHQPSTRSSQSETILSSLSRMSRQRRRRSRSTTASTSPTFQLPLSTKQTSPSNRWSILTPPTPQTKTMRPTRLPLKQARSLRKSSHQVVNPNLKRSRVHSLFLSSPPLARPLSFLKKLRQVATGRTLRGQASCYSSTASRFGGNYLLVCQSRSKACGCEVEKVLFVTSSSGTGVRPSGSTGNKKGSVTTLKAFKANGSSISVGKKIVMGMKEGKCSTSINNNINTKTQFYTHQMNGFDEPTRNTTFIPLFLHFVPQLRFTSHLKAPIISTHECAVRLPFFMLPKIFHANSRTLSNSDKATPTKHAQISTPEPGYTRTDPHSHCLFAS